MREILANTARATVGEVVFTKHLPSDFGNEPVRVKPGADLRVLSPGFQRCANDLLLVARMFVRPGDAVWDIGSNQGIFSVAAAARAGAEGRVYSVEADPQYAALQHDTFSRLSPRSAPCAVLCAAIADRHGVLDFGVHEKGSARSGLVETAAARPASSKPVLGVTLDFLMEAWGSPSVVKIDVEGADLLALKGATKLLSEARPIIYTEMTKDTFAETSLLFRRAGYDLRRLDSGRLPQLDSFGAYVVALPNERKSEFIAA